MRNVISATLLLTGAAALAACSNDASDQNIVIDNNVAAGADIEAVPTDESSASEDQANGGAEDKATADDMSANNSL